MPSRLKSLELHGYKTFANRTFFEFAETVTAIVGPNGSGKSNIADSLRWVLGEQSYSLLRGRKTEDMIFSGSESRARAGLASATITFDNSDDWLPIDFSEVAITRRAFRDGLNEYLLNGQRVRLKDISELLAEFGLAERTYTIIGQGLVDAALSLKADERRRLFEEAAGIGLHRSRREEAIRRLETTKRNLERVEDILAELKPRLVSLERQAKRGKEYEQVRVDLQLLLREWYGFHWHEAQNELTQAQTSERQQEAKLELSRRDQEAAEAYLSELRGLVQSRRDDLNKWHKALSEQHLKREEAIRRLTLEEERIRSFGRQKENDLKTLNTLEAEFQILSEQLNNSNEEIEVLNSELVETQKQAENARNAFDQGQINRARIELQIQATRQSLNQLNGDQGKIQARLIESQSQAQRISASQIPAKEELKEAELQLQRAKDEFEIYQKKADGAKKELDIIERSRATFRKRIQDVEAKIAEAEEKRTVLNTDEARLKAENDILNQADHALTGYATGTKLLLIAARQERLKGREVR